MNLFVKWIVNAAAIYFAAWLITGIQVADFWAALWVSLVIGLINAFIKPILTLVSLPLIMVTFGLFLLVINAVVLMFASELVENFTIDGFWPALWGSLIISFVSYILDPPNKNKPGNGNQTQVHINQQ